MRNIRLLLFGVTALSLAAITSSSAQQSDNARRQPKQTHDKGIDDVLPPGQEKKIGERNVAGVTIITRADGTLVAQLDESFHDAIMATRRTDGSVVYTCLHGLPAAGGKVTAHAPVKAKPPISTLEEK